MGKNRKHNDVIFKKGRETPTKTKIGRYRWSHVLEKDNSEICHSSENVHNMLIQNCVINGKGKCSSLLYVILLG